MLAKTTSYFLGEKRKKKQVEVQVYKNVEFCRVYQNIELMYRELIISHFTSASKTTDTSSNMATSDERTKAHFNINPATNLYTYRYRYNAAETSPWRQSGRAISEPHHGDA